MWRLRKIKMKKIVILVILLAMASITQTFGQENTNSNKIGPSVSLCGADKDSAVIKYSDLLKCEELTLIYKDVNGKIFESNSKLTIKSFEIGFKTDEIYKTIKNIGNRLTRQTLEFINNIDSKNAKKLFFDEIILIESDGKTEKKIDGIFIIIEE